MRFVLSMRKSLDMCRVCLTGILKPVCMALQMFVKGFRNMAYVVINPNIAETFIRSDQMSFQLLLVRWSLISSVRSNSM